MTTQDSLAKRAISSTLWRTAASLIGSLILFGRSILLARWVPVEAFGIYGYASAIIGVSSILADFGIGTAFIHRAEETANESQAAANYFTVKAILTLLWAGLVTSYGHIFIEPQYRPTLLILTLIHAGTSFTAAPRLILHRRVVHRRLSLLGTLSVVVGSGASLVFAQLGYPIWALMITNLATLVVNVVGLYCWRAVWRPRIRWDPPIVRYLLGFGSRTFPASLLARVLDRLDDIWTGSTLGSTAAGYYSKSYAFATYPSRVIAAPLIQVSAGSYAVLKGDRKRLSEAFFRVNAALIRSGFLFGGLLALIAPEFIRILVGDQWLPMLDAYRLMLVFTLLDPIKVTISNLFFAIGEPEQVSKTRLVQIVVLTAGLISLGPRLGIAGVAIAVDAMLLIGIVLLLLRAKAYVDFSAKRLFIVPTVALLLGTIIARGALIIPGVMGSDWRTAGVKICTFVIIYSAGLLSLERYQTMKMADWILTSLLQRTQSRKAKQMTG